MDRQRDPHRPVPAEQPAHRRGRILYQIHGEKPNITNGEQDATDRSKCHW